jgi:four helix bundle protein
MFVFEKSVEYGNAILIKSFNFSKRIVNLYTHLLKNDFKLEPLYKQLLRSGTSVGANVSESQYASSKKDFIFKLQIALKEAFESEYWLKLLYETGHIKEKEFESIHSDCKEIIKLLISIIKSSKLIQ